MASKAGNVVSKIPGGQKAIELAGKAASATKKAAGAVASVTATVVSKVGNVAGEVATVAGKAAGTVGGLAGKVISKLPFGGKILGVAEKVGMFAAKRILPKVAGLFAGPAGWVFDAVSVGMDAYDLYKYVRGKFDKPSDQKEGSAEKTEGKSSPKQDVLPPKADNPHVQGIQQALQTNVETSPVMLNKNAQQPKGGNNLRGLVPANTNTKLNRGEYDHMAQQFVFKNGAEFPTPKASDLAQACKIISMTNNYTMNNNQRYNFNITSTSADPMQIAQQVKRDLAQNSAAAVQMHKV